MIEWFLQIIEVGRNEQADLLRKECKSGAFLSGLLVRRVITKLDDVKTPFYIQRKDQRGGPRFLNNILYYREADQNRKVAFGLLEQKSLFSLKRAIVNIKNDCSNASLLHQPRMHNP